MVGENLKKKFGELSSFLIERTFTSTNLVQAVRRTATKLCSESKTLYSTCSGNCSSSSTNLASDWLKPESSPMEEDENWDRNLWLTARMFSAARFGGIGLICGLVGGSALSVEPSR